MSFETNRSLIKCSLGLCRRGLESTTTRLGGTRKIQHGYKYTKMLKPFFGGVILLIGGETEGGHHCSIHIKRRVKQGKCCVRKQKKSLLTRSKKSMIPKSTLGALPSPCSPCYPSKRYARFPGGNVLFPLDPLHLQPLGSANLPNLKPLKNIPLVLGLTPSQAGLRGTIDCNTLEEQEK